MVISDDGTYPIREVYTKHPYKSFPYNPRDGCPSGYKITGNKKMCIPDLATARIEITPLSMLVGRDESPNKIRRFVRKYLCDNIGNLGFMVFDKDTGKRLDSEYWLKNR